MIYCVEDERNIRELLVYTLGTTGFEAKGFSDGKEFQKALKEELPELILLDIMLPGEDGYSLLEELKKEPRTSEIPVIMVTAKEAEYDKVRGLEGGADDYITKPFEIQEVLARVQVQLRHGVQEGNGNVLSYKQMVLDREKFQIEVEGKPLEKITKQEFSILELLLKHPKQVFSKEDIFEYAWEEPYMGETKTLDVHISNIRKKVKEVTKEEYIETVWGIGYRLQQ